MADLSITVRPPTQAILPTLKYKPEVPHVTPGDVVCDSHDRLRGHGTYVKDEELYSCVAGVVQQINKLVKVQPLKLRYNGEVGDIIVGRIKEVQQKRWKVETYSRVDSVLHLSYVNLPGGELRRRNVADELTMREYLNEGDLVSAEVQQIHSDGSLSLHTRSLKYGKLGQGCVVKVPPSLVKRCKNHIHNLPCGATVILANNGNIWIQKTAETNENDKGHGGFVVDNNPVSLEDREVIARLRNCIKALTMFRVSLYDTSLMYMFEESMQYSVKQLLNPELISELVGQVVEKLNQAEN